MRSHRLDKPMKGETSIVLYYNELPQEPRFGIAGNIAAGAK
jgi:hypothetical protein